MFYPHALQLKQVHSAFINQTRMWSWENICNDRANKNICQTEAQFLLYKMQSLFIESSRVGLILLFRITKQRYTAQE